MKITDSRSDYCFNWTYWVCECGTRVSVGDGIGGKRENWHVTKNGKTMDIYVND